MRCTVLVPTGALGFGFPDEELDRGVSERPDVIAVDAGSTDSGPYYLGKPSPKMALQSVRHDLRRLMLARERLGIPLVVGSCGTSGTDEGVNWVADICKDICRDEKLSPNIALIYSEQNTEILKLKLASGKIKPIEPSSNLTYAEIDSCQHIVALCGPEPMSDAIAAGADIVLCGRATDTAVLAAVPLMKGFPPGACWHAAKVAECGALCAESAMTASGLGGVLVRIDSHGFEIEPLALDTSCTTRTVHMHMLYENSNPYVLYEPGGILDVSNAQYTQISNRTVRVSNSMWTNAPYTHKLEGAGIAGYQTMIIMGVRDRDVLCDIDGWMQKLRTFVANRVYNITNLAANEYDISLRAYGWNGVGKPLSRKYIPNEVGVLCVVTAGSQNAATQIARIINPYLFHFPAEKSNAVPSFAYPFSPAEIERGALYEFKLNHTVMVDSPSELIRTIFQ